MPLSRKSSRRFHFQSLEERLCLASVAPDFLEHPIVEGPLDDPADLKSYDIDGDGRLDALAMSDIRDQLFWMKNLGPEAGYSRPLIISGDFDSMLGTLAADLDADGDLDVFTWSRATRGVSQIVWFENTDGQGSFGGQQTLATESTGSRLDNVFAVDFDRDGNVDVVTSTRASRVRAPDSGHWINWFRNQGNATFTDAIPIDEGGPDMATSIDVGDIDGDGDLDVVSSRVRYANQLYHHDQIVWFANRDGSGDFSQPRKITSVSSGADEVILADIDSDNDLDVLFSAWDDQSLGWIQNMNGRGQFDSFYPVATERTRMLRAADFDNDGDLDIVANTVPSTNSVEGQLVWFEQLSPDRFSEANIVMELYYADSLWVDDVDQDGDQDVWSATGWFSVGFNWFNNLDGRGAFSDGEVVGYWAHELQEIEAGDVDGDGDLDVVSTSWTNQLVAWYENVDGEMTFEGQHIVWGLANHVGALDLADFDSDGDMDIVTSWLSENRTDGFIGWFESDQGEFGEPMVILAAHARSIRADDLDGDGDPDIIASLTNGLSWFPNLGDGSFGDARLLGGFADHIELIDLDGDGDRDVITSIYGLYGSPIYWYEHTDGHGGFANQNLIANTYARDIVVGDIDLDGRPDVVAKGSAIEWYRFDDRTKSLQLQSRFGDVDDEGPVELADMDLDGDLDFLSPGERGNEFVWHENVASGEAVEHQITIDPQGSNPRQLSQLVVRDFDSDGDPDVLAGFEYFDKVAIYENRISADVQSALFEPAVALGAVDSFGVATGDLDGDGDADAVFVGNATTSNRVFLNDGWGRLVESTAQLGDSTGYHVELADVDDDDDLDIWVSHGQAGAAEADKLWLNDGRANFVSSDQTLGTVSSSGVAFGDVDNDGDLDAAVASYAADEPNQLWWNDGSGQFTLSDWNLGTGRTVALEWHDLDLDGNLDLVVANEDQPHFVFLNDGASLQPSSSLSESSARDLAIAVLDDDRYPDVYVANANGSDGIAQSDTVYQNRLTHMYWDIDEQLGQSAGSSVAIGDLDLDGDNDTFVTNWSNQPNSVWLHVNFGFFIEAGTLGSATSAHVSLADVDQDGDLDAIVANVDQSSVIYTNTVRVARKPGDANLDGVFDTADLIQVFAAGQFEDDVPGNSTWQEGDWNGDGEFDTSDLVTAFQAGWYVAE